MARRLFGQIGEEPIYEIGIRSKAGAEALILNWGAVIRDFVVPLRGEKQRVVLGLDKLDDYVKYSPHLGALAGRYANRIRDGKFAIDGESYQLEKNFLGKHNLHGGSAGFGQRPWQVAAYDDSSVTLVLVSRDGDGGYPGQLTTTLTYRFVDDLTLRTEIMAMTDRPTIINLALHSYFNLDGSDDILDHQLQIESDFITTLDPELIPTGEIRQVTDTPYDFRTLRPIWYQSAEGGVFHYDQNFMLRQTSGALNRAATVKSSRNGLSLEVWTTEPCIQFYDAKNLNVPVPGIGMKRLTARAGFCLEPQRPPDSPNRAHFGDPVLRPGQIYRQITDYRFNSPRN
jgi:aldose 1-epimerase